MTEPMNIAQIGARYRTGGLAPVEVVTACLAQIASTEPAAHAWVEVDRDGALTVARQA